MTAVVWYSKGILSRRVCSVYIHPFIHPSIHPFGTYGCYCVPNMCRHCSNCWGFCSEQNRNSCSGTKWWGTIYFLKPETPFSPPSPPLSCWMKGEEPRAEVEPGDLRTSPGSATNLPRGLGTRPSVLNSKQLGFPVLSLKASPSEIRCFLVIPQFIHRLLF